MTGITANNKPYDGTTAATLNTGGASCMRVVSGDTGVTFSAAGATGTFASPDVANGIAVQVAGITFGGTTQDGTAASVDYTLTQPTTTANISQATLTVTGITAHNKPYDGTETATLNTSSAALVRAVSGDTGVTFSAAGATGTFASPDAASGITVQVAGITFSGTTQDGTAASVDYTLTQPTTTANIGQATLTVTGITANNKALRRHHSGNAQHRARRPGWGGQRRHGRDVQCRGGHGHVCLAQRGQRHHGAGGRHHRRRHDSGRYGGERGLHADGDDDGEHCPGRVGDDHGRRGPFTYTGSAHSGFGTVTGAGGLNTSATSFTYSANSNGTGTADRTDAGTYYVTAHYAGDANHMASDGAAVAVTIKPLAVNLTGSRTYDGTTGAASSILTVSNAISGDTVNVASGTGTLASKNAGRNRSLLSVRWHSAITRPATTR